MFFSPRLAGHAFRAVSAPMAMTGLLLATTIPVQALPEARQAVAEDKAIARGGCKTGSQTLFFAPHPMLESLTMEGFGDSLHAQLEAPVRELGYCLEEIKDYRAVLDTAAYGEAKVLQTLVQDGNGSRTILVALLRVVDMARGNPQEALSRPLASIRFQTAEVAALPSILAKKITENLRSQYVADLLVSSHPAGAAVRTPAGLEGATPVEWVMPLGIVQVTLEKKGYLPLRREVNLSAPGRHAYDLQLTKRRFYHSRFIYPALAAGAISLIAFGLENHYYDEYQSLGAEDRKNRPEAFGETFHVAKTFEGIAYTAMGLAWLNLTLCIAF